MTVETIQTVETPTDTTLSIQKRRREHSHAKAQRNYIYAYLERFGKLPTTKQLMEILEVKQWIAERRIAEVVKEVVDPQRIDRIRAQIYGQLENRLSNMSDSQIVLLTLGLTPKLIQKQISGELSHKVREERDVEELLDELYGRKSVQTGDSEKQVDTPHPNAEASPVPSP